VGDADDVTACAKVLRDLRERADPDKVAGMAACGISREGTLGVSVRDLRRMARPLRPDHRLALELWETGVHEARLMAVFVDDPAAVTERQMECWATEFDSWDVCDQACTSLFDVSPYGWRKAVEWAGREEEFVKRGGFALMAGLAVHDRWAEDARFLELLPVIVREADDGRDYVKKAVSWALRSIGKRGAALNAAAIGAAEEVEGRESRAAGWVARDVLRELRSEKVRRRLGLETGRP